MPADRVTIEHLEIRFDVEAGDEDEAFGRLFQRYIDAWGRAQEEQQRRHSRLDADRTIGYREGRR